MNLSKNCKKKYTKIIIDINKLEKDYWKWVLDNYINKIDNRKKQYFLSHKFMKRIRENEEYIADIIKKCWRYWWYLSILDSIVLENNNFDIDKFQNLFDLNYHKLMRILRVFKKNNVIKKKWRYFFLNPLFWFYWQNIKQELVVLFEEEIKKCDKKTKDRFKRNAFK